jgi:hypothetical protein
MGSFIDHGMPASPDDWPANTLLALDQFVQGDVVSCPPLVYHGDPRRAVFATTVDYGKYHNSPMPMVVEPPSRWAIITSATCDISELDKKAPKFPFVQISPVVDMSDISDGNKNWLRQDKYTYLLYLPALGEHEVGFWVADFRIEYPVEKGWLAERPRVQGFYTEKDKEKVGLAVSHMRGRPALGKSVYRNIVEPLGDSLGQLRSKDRLLADRVDETTSEWAIRVDNRLRPSRIEIVFLSADQDLPADVALWWRQAVDLLRSRVNDDKVELTIVGPTFERLDRLPASDYLSLIILPSPHKKFSD